MYSVDHQCLKGPVATLFPTVVVEPHPSCWSARCCLAVPSEAFAFCTRLPGVIQGAAVCLAREGGLLTACPGAETQVALLQMCVPGLVFLRPQTWADPFHGDSHSPKDSAAVSWSFSLSSKECMVLGLKPLAQSVLF